MDESDALSQRLDATVVHALWKQSKQVFVESYRILHDWSVERSLFEGERLLGEYRVVDEPRLGPIPVFRREVPLTSAEDGRRWFAGNTSPYITTCSPMTDPPAPPTGPAVQPTPNWVEVLESTALADEFSRRSDFAPETIAPDDVLWDRAYWRDWTGVRSLRMEGGVMIETLDLVGLKLTLPPRQDRAFEIVAALELDLTELVVLEYQAAVLHLNNSVLFQVRRTARLSDDDYIAKYVTPLIDRTPNDE